MLHKESIDTQTSRLLEALSLFFYCLIAKAAVIPKLHLFLLSEIAASRERDVFPSQDLLHFEHNNSSSSSIESALLLCKNDLHSRSKSPHPDGNPVTTPVPPSQVLGKVKDFLGVMSEVNKRLHLDAKDNSSKDYDIEVLSGNESQYIELDLMLGVADLHTPEAVAAAESAIAGYQPVIPLAASSSETESEDSSDEDDDDDDSDDDNSHDSNEKVSFPAKSEISKLSEDKSSRDFTS